MPKKDLPLEALFCSTRLQPAKMKIHHWLLFIMYFPVGCVLALVRFVCVFLVAIVAPEKYRYRFFRYIGGLVCYINQTKADLAVDMPKKGALILSNHSNYLDPIVINAAVAKSPHLDTVIWHGVNFFSRVICRPTVSVLDKGGNRAFLQQLYQANEHHNMIVFPEGTVTDSVSGILQFQRSVFRLKQPIYLMAIRYHRAFPFLQGKAMSRQMGFEVLVDLFQPWIKVELIPLGEFKRDPHNTPQQQASLAQNIIANALGLEPTQWDKHDRHQYLFADEATLDK